MENPKRLFYNDYAHCIQYDHKFHTLTYMMMGEEIVEEKACCLNERNMVAGLFKDYTRRYAITPRLY